MSSNNTLESAIIEGKQLREAAEEAAKKKILEAYAPHIKQLIENKIDAWANGEDVSLFEEDSTNPLPPVDDLMAPPVTDGTTTDAPLAQPPTTPVPSDLPAPLPIDSKTTVGEEVPVTPVSADPAMGGETQVTVTATPTADGKLTLNLDDLLSKIKDQLNLTVVAEPAPMPAETNSVDAMPVSDPTVTPPVPPVVGPTPEEQQNFTAAVENKLNLISKLMNESLTEEEYSLVIEKLKNIYSMVDTSLVPSEEIKQSLSLKMNKLYENLKTRYTYKSKGNNTMAKSLVDLIFENDETMSLDTPSKDETTAPTDSTEAETVSMDNGVSGSSSPETSETHVDAKGLDIGVDVDGEGGNDLTMHMGADGDLDIEIDPELLQVLRDMEAEMSGDMGGSSEDTESEGSDLDVGVVDDSRGDTRKDPLAAEQVPEKMMLNAGEGHTHKDDEEASACKECNSASEENVFEGLSDDVELEIDEAQLMEAMKAAKGLAGLANEKGKNTTEFPKGDAVADGKSKKDGLEGKLKNVKGLAATDGKVEDHQPSDPKNPTPVVGSGKQEEVSKNVGSKKEQTDANKKLDEMLKSVSELSLLNTKLLYSNRFLALEDLSKKQKQQIVEHLNSAKTLQEANDVYSKLKAAYDKSKAAKAKPPVVTTEGKRGSASKPMSVVTEQKAAPSANSPTIDLERLAILAGLVKN